MTHSTVIWNGKEQKRWLKRLPNGKFAWGFTKRECERHYIDEKTT